MLDSALMNDLPVDLGLLRERVRDLRAELGDETSPAGDATRRAAGDPGLVCDALLQLFDLLEQTGGGADSGEMTALGEYGLQLLEELGATARGHAGATRGTTIEQLCLPFALWIARHGGELRDLAPVVNGLAFQANQQSRPDAMAALYVCCCELVDAVSPRQHEDIERPGHPFRLLLLNRAIVATRSHNPDFIVTAFDAILEHVPEEGPAFFAEAMEQMAVIDYPEHVRQLVRRYFVAHAKPRQLH